MNIHGQQMRTIWLEEGGDSVGEIDQNFLPHSLKICSLQSCSDVAYAIQNMIVRGAPLIGVAGAYGLMLALQEEPNDKSMKAAFVQLNSTRPTAINLAWALKRVCKKVKALHPSESADAARIEAGIIAEEDVGMCASIGNHGLQIFKDLAKL